MYHSPKKIKYCLCLLGSIFNRKNKLFDFAFLFLLSRWALSSYLQKFRKLSDQWRSWTCFKPIQSSFHHFNGIHFIPLPAEHQPGTEKGCFNTKFKKPTSSKLIIKRTNSSKQIKKNMDTRSKSVNNMDQMWQLLCKVWPPQNTIFWFINTWTILVQEYIDANPLCWLNL